MTPGIALLLLGFIAAVSGWKNQSLVDTALGRVNRKATGNVSSGDGGGDNGNFQGGDFPLPGAGGVTSLMPAPAGTTSIDGKPVPNWIAVYVKFARNHGWRGQVTSGYRSLAEQTSLWNNRANNSNPVATPGHSNHQYTTFPRGAVDVSDPDGFERALRQFMGPVPLKRDPSIGDPVHFSATGR